MHDANTREWSIRYQAFILYGANSSIEHDDLDETTRVKVTTLLVIATDFTLG